MLQTIAFTLTLLYQVAAMSLRRKWTLSGFRFCRVALAHGLGSPICTDLIRRLSSKPITVATDARSATSPQLAYGPSDPPPVFGLARLGCSARARLASTADGEAQPESAKAPDSTIYCRRYLLSFGVLRQPLALNQLPLTVRTQWGQLPHLCLLKHKAKQP